MKSKKQIIDHPPRFLTVLISACLLLLLFVTFSLLEFSRTKSNITTMLKDEGFTLLDALIASGERSILAYEESELLMQKRLLDNASWIEQLDFQSNLSRSVLDEISARTSLYRILVYDRYGSLSISSSPSVHEATETFPTVQAEIRKFLAQTTSDSLIIGFRQGRSPLQQRYAVVLRRRKGGAVVVVGDAERLIEFRKELGPGRLIQEIGNQPGIEYVVLQDTIGIMLASTNITSINRIQTDSFLVRIYESRSRDSRFYRWQGKKVFEIAGDFQVEDENIGLFRIGLGTSHYQHILRNTRYRLIFIVVLFVLAGAAGISVFVSRQNLQLLSQAYKRVQTHTGEILQKMKDGVITADQNRHITVFNDAASGIFHIKPSKAVGSAVSLLPPAVCSVIKESLDTGTAGARIREKVIIRKKERTLSLRTSILKNDQGVSDTVILVVTDLTEQKRLEEALRQKEKQSAMGRLAAGVAHEIRNPVNAINMIAQRFLNEFKPSTDREEYENLARILIKESKRSDEIIRRFLEYARPAELNRSTVSAAKIFYEVKDIMKSSAEAKNTEIKIHIIRDAVLYIDANQIKQVFINLVQNSLNAISSKGQITITGNTDKKYYIISVTDNGVGIPEHHRDKIFDLYFTTSKDGLGMGLAIVYQIINRHNGSIEVVSSEGTGTEFIIKLPVKDT